jgi:spermidine synthase
MTRTTFLALVLPIVLVAFDHAAAGEKVLCEKVSRYNKILVTEDEQGLRTLWFDTRRLQQSVMKPGDPDHIEFAYVRAMPIGLALVEKPQRMLFIGLGGGTLPSFLHKHYPKTTIDVVEIDPDVVDVAKTFFGFREDSTMHAHVQDGRAFIEKCRRPYDIIFLDAYGADNIPYRLATREFLHAVREALNPKGIAVANVVGPKRNPLYDSMVRTYQDVFDELYVLELRGTNNRILIAQPYKGRFRGVDMARQARKVSQEKHFRFDMADFILYGFQKAGNNASVGRVLTDDDEPGNPTKDEGPKNSNRKGGRTGKSARLTKLPLA